MAFYGFRFDGKRGRKSVLAVENKIYPITSGDILNEGKSVLDACTGSGFSDCSSFIALFKKYYGVTPRKYKLKTLYKG